MTNKRALVDKFADNYVDKPVEKAVDNLVNNSVDNTELEEDSWFSALAEHLQQLYVHVDNAKNIQLKQMINQLGQALNVGHTCLVTDDAELNNNQLEHPAIVDEIQATQHPAPLVRAGDYLYFFRQWQQEHQLSAQLVRILRAHSAVSAQAGQSLAIEPTLNQRQQQAVQLATTQAFSLITGGPGTGKTFTLVQIVKTLQQQQPDLRIALAAPTGKAAQRMQSVLDTAFLTANISSERIQKAQTVHRLLGLGNTGKPQFHLHATLPYDLIVLDEGSMLDLALASQLFAAIAAGTRLIILGDADQLAAVDAGAVLADLQQTPALKPYQVHLVQSQRFKADEGIGQLANAILQQDLVQVWQALKHSPQQLSYFNPQLYSDQQLFDQLWQGFLPYVRALVQQVPIDALFKAFDQYRILSAMRAGRLGTRRINQEMTKRLQQALQQMSSRAEWFNGRPVMMNRNDYNLKLSNGDIGLCLKDEQGKWQVYFPHMPQPVAVARLPLQDISTAFALTIHKSQGSEFEQVAVVLDDTAKELLSRELFYTAVTRAKTAVQVWSQQQDIEQALRNKALRQSGLKRQLQKMILNDTQ